MDSLNGLYPINQIGSDGFSWWIGQVESEKADDEKLSGRYKVRIVGTHPKSCEAVSWEDLPWAITMMPVTNPHTPGGATSVSDQLGKGVWVIGFYLDNLQQQPIIMGSVGRVANSTSEKTADDPTPGENCKSFTTYIPEDAKVAFDQPTPAVGEKSAVTVTEAGLAPTGTISETGEGKINDGPTNFQVAKYSKNTDLNPAGINFCVEKADKCGKETDLKKTFTRLFSEMLAEVQNNDGKLGTFLIAPLSGELHDAIGIGRKYVNKSILVVRTFVASVKGFILEKIKAGIKDLINMLLYPSDTGNALTPLTKFFNDILANVGCQMADLGDRLASFLEDLIFGYLFDVYKAAACLVDNFVDGLLSKIQSLMNELLESVLGPLQDLLGAAASAINIIGDAINYVLDLLGIQCNGPGKSCSKTTVACTNCDSDKRDDFLDELLKNITDDLFPVTGEDWSRYTCDEAYEGNTLQPTKVIFVGGVQNPPVPNSIQYDISDIKVEEGDEAAFVVTRIGYLDVSSSVKYTTRNGSATEGTDYLKSSGILGFAPGESEKKILVRTLTDTESEGDEDFFVSIRKDSPGTIPAFAKKTVAKCVITESTIRTPGLPSPAPGDPPPSPPPAPTESPDTIIPDIINARDVNPDPTVDPTDTTPTYKVVSDRSSVKEGQFIKYTITTTNVETGRTLFYRLFGTGITPNDIVNNSLSGSFTIENNTATVIIGINVDSELEDEEILTFGIAGTTASTNVLILSDTSGFSPEELDASEDSSSNTNSRTDPPRNPTVDPAKIITDPGGGIIDIPIDEPGDPYTELPVVIIPGEGFRASALPLLDSTGRITEIRITDPGFGYKINTPQTSDKECIIDSFTMLNPGREYTSSPQVYINGDNTIADAVVENGRVISVRIKNRSIVFDRYPKVLIIGGGGYGAKFIPSFSCLDRDVRVTVGSAKIGTGKYIDCP
tara:strand:+ start:9758 stop:12610 length:2853 start_codon:yes stop_codon:yes gene_type:complete